MIKREDGTKRRSSFTYSESQAATTIEVTVLIVISSILWFTGWQIAAVALLIWATLALLAHFNRRYKDDK